MTHVVRLFLTGIVALMFSEGLGGSAWAIDMNFEVHLSVTIGEPTELVITGFTKVMPVEPPFYAAEIAANSTWVRVNVADVDPGGYFLDLRQPGIRRTFPFTVNPDGSIVFDPSLGVQQEGSRVILSP